MLLYNFSTLYLACAGARSSCANELDHHSICLLIADGYAPFCLVPAAWGWSLFGVVWGLAALGSPGAVAMADGRRESSVVIYVLMGWRAALCGPCSAAGRSGNERLRVGCGRVLYTGGRRLPTRSTPA